MTTIVLTSKTMKDVKDAKKAGEQALLAEDMIDATLIEVDGKVNVVGQPHHVNYYPDDGGELGIAWNFVVPPIPGLPVKVGIKVGNAKEQGQEEDMEVLWIDQARLQDGQKLETTLNYHGGAHYYGRSDHIWIDQRQLVDLRVYPVLGQLQVNVGSGRYIFRGKERYFGGQRNIALTDYQPATGTKRAAGLFLDAAGVLQVIGGSVVPRSALPVPEPAWPQVAFKLGLVVLYGIGDQDYIDYEDIKPRKTLYGDSGMTLLQMRVFS